VRIQLRHLIHRCDADAVSLAEGSIRITGMRGGQGSPESLARGMLSKGFPVNPGELPTFPGAWAPVTPNPNLTRSLGMRALPTGSEQTLAEEKPVAKGDQRRQLRVDEQSYDPIVPRKVENRRAPAGGGHGIHWREGANR
jgi:hypothetical protein